MAAKGERHKVLAVATVVATEVMTMVMFFFIKWDEDGR